MSKPSDENQDEKIIESIKAGIIPKSLINFQPLKDVKERVADLIFREKVGDLSTNEKTELDHFLMLEHLLRLAKTRTY